MGELTQELKRDEAAATRRNRTQGPVGQIGDSGRRDMAIPMDAFLRGSQKMGTECWEDREFCDDMVRRYPHLKVPQRGKIMVTTTELEGRGKLRSRFGRVKERIVFRDGKKHVVYRD